MGMPVVTVASGGMPVVDVTATTGRGTPVTEATNGFGRAVTKVASGGMAVAYETLVVWPPPPVVTYTTWNPADKDTHITLSGGNLTAVGTGGWTGLVRTVRSYSTGKYYWECTFNATQGLSGVGMAIGSLSVVTTDFTSVVAGHSGLIRLGSVYADGNSSLTIGGVSSQTINFGTITSGTVICVAVDLTAKLIWWRLGAGGNWNNLAGRDPATGVGGVGIPNVGLAFPTGCFGGADTLISNFGSTAFTGAVPPGFTSGWPT